MAVRTRLRPRQPSIRRFGLETGTTLAFIATVVMLISLFGWVTNRWTRDALVQAQIDRINALADAREAEISALLDNYQENAQLIASRTRMRALMAEHAGDPSPELAAELTKIVIDASVGVESIESVTLIDGSGTVIAGTDGTLVGAHATDAPEVFGELPPLGAPGELQPLNEGSDLQLVAFAPAVHEGSYVGTVHIAYSSDAINDAILNAGFGQTGEIVLGFRDEQEGVARFVTPVRNRTDAVGRELAPLTDQRVPMIRALEGDEVAMAEGAIDYGGAPVTAVTRFIPSIGWGLVAKIDTAEVIGQLTFVRNSVLALGVGLAAVGAGAGLLMGHRLRRELSSRVLAQKQFTSLFTSSPTPALLVAPGGTIQLANQRASDLLGYSPTQLCGLSFDHLVPPDPGEEGLDLPDRLARSAHSERNSTGRDVVAVAAKGHPIPVQLDLVQIETATEPMVLVALTDLTERLQAAAALEERAGELAQRNSDLDSFASIAAHDLKAPLRAMESLADFVLDDAGEALPAQSREDLGTLKQRCRRLTALVEGLLLYARTGRDDAEPAWVDTDALLTDLIELYLPADRFTVTRANPLPEVLGPPAAVELVFRNLLMNVAKHHDRDHGRVDIGCQHRGGYLCFTVTDDGPGIPAEHADRIFQLFKTLESRDQKEGSGLGLSVVRKTVEAHGGVIDLVDTGPGRGASFEIRWPHHEAPPPPEPATKPDREVAYV